MKIGDFLQCVGGFKKRETTNGKLIFAGLLSLTLKGNIELPHILQFEESSEFNIELHCTTELMIYFRDEDLYLSVGEIQNQYKREKDCSRPPTILLEFNHFNALLFPRDEFETRSDAELYVHRTIRNLKEFKACMSPLQLEECPASEYERKWLNIIKSAAELQGPFEMQSIDNLAANYLELCKLAPKQVENEFESLKGLVAELINSGEYDRFSLDGLEEKVAVFEMQSLCSNTFRI